jgi:hypothetical protein
MPLAVSIPTTVTARTDGCIDDLIRVFLDTATNREREPHAAPLAIHVTSRPHGGDSEPLRRRGLVSAPKFVAEGGMLNTRLLLIILPLDKFEAWSANIRKILADKRGTYGELESTLGQFNSILDD